MLFICYCEFTTQRGENRHTDIENLVTLIHTNKINAMSGNFYHTVW